MLSLPLPDTVHTQFTNSIFISTFPKTRISRVSVSLLRLPAVKSPQNTRSRYVCKAGTDCRYVVGSQRWQQWKGGSFLLPEFQAITSSKVSHGCSIVYKFLIDWRRWCSMWWSFGTGIGNVESQSLETLQGRMDAGWWAAGGNIIAHWLHCCDYDNERNRMS